MNFTFSALVAITANWQDTCCVAMYLDASLIYWRYWNPWIGVLSQKTYDWISSTFESPNTLTKKLTVTSHHTTCSNLINTFGTFRSTVDSELGERRCGFGYYRDCNGWENRGWRWSGVGGSGSIGVGCGWAGTGACDEWWGYALSQSWPEMWWDGRALVSVGYRRRMFDARYLWRRPKYMHIFMLKQVICTFTCLNKVWVPFCVNDMQRRRN